VFRQEFSIPQTPNSPESSPEEKLSFWEQLLAIPEGDWAENGSKGFKVYLYDHEVQQRPNPYLALITHSFDIEWIKQEFGGGVYRALLNNTSGTAVAREIFAISGESKRKPSTNVQNVQNALAAAVPADSFQTSVLNMIQEGQRRQEALIERLMDRDRERTALPPLPAVVDPMALMKPVLEGVVGMFTSMIPKPSNPLDDLIKLKQLMGEPKDVFTELTKFKELGLIGGTGGGGDLLKQLEVVFAVVEKMGIGGGGSKSVLEVIADKGPEMLGKIVTGIGEYRALEEARMKTAKEIAGLQANQRTLASAQPLPAPSQRAPQPAPLPNAQAPVASQLQVEPITEQPPAAVQAEFTEAQINQVKAQIVQSIANGESGADIFGFLKITAPVFLTGMLLGDGGKVTGVITENQLAMFCASDPVLSQATQLPRFREAIRELLEELKFAVMGEEEGPDVAT